MENNKVKILNLIIPLLSIGVILVFWSIASAVVDSSFILPTISQTVESLFALFLSGDFYLALWLTFLRSLIAFLVSFAVAFCLAFFSAKHQFVKRAIEPIIGVLRALPTIAIVLILLIWTSSQIAPMIVTMLVVLPTCYTNMYSAFSSIDKTVSEAGMVDGADKKRLLLLVEFPQVAPAFYSAIGSGLSLNFKLMVAAEVIAQTADSIGLLLNTSKAYFETPTMMALVLVSVLVGLVIESIFNAISKSAGDWR